MGADEGLRRRAPRRRGARIKRKGTRNAGAPRRRSNRVVRCTASALRKRVSPLTVSRETEENQKKATNVRNSFGRADRLPEIAFCPFRMRYCEIGMPLRVIGAKEHNLRDVSLMIGDGFTVVTGVSGSGKSSLVFDTIYREARRRFADVFAVHQEPPARVESIQGLGPAVSVGQDLLNRNPGSTLATATGIHPLLRLAFARFGDRQCPGCRASISVATEAEVVSSCSELAAGRQVRVGAVLQRYAHGAHRTLRALVAERRDRSGSRPSVRNRGGDGRTRTGGARDVAEATRRNGPLVEIDGALVLRVGRVGPASTSDEVRRLVSAAAATGAQSVGLDTDEGATFFSLAPLCPHCARPLSDPQPVHFHSACPACGGDGCSLCDGTGVHPQAATVTLGGMRLFELLELTCGELASPEFAAGIFRTVRSQPLVDELAARLELLDRLGLGYVSLNRPSPSLSRGESQRVRIAMVLAAPLESMTHILDEPTIGQHAADVERLLPMLRSLPGRILCVEHDPQVIIDADEVVDLGPGGGGSGGRLIYHGPPSVLLRKETATAHALRRACGGDEPALESTVPSGANGWIHLRGGELRTLHGVDISLPVARLTCVSGVSGSGKTTLVFDILGESAGQSRPIHCQACDAPIDRVVSVDQGPIGRNPRSTPATYTKLADKLRELYSDRTGLRPSHFSYNRVEGACPDCCGIGAIEVQLKHLDRRWLTCATCGGSRFREDIANVRIALGGTEIGIAELYDSSVSEARTLFEDEQRHEDILAILATLEDVGLGYLALGQASPTLSGGEAQRIKLSKYLHSRLKARTLMLLDEPTTGLHAGDVERLVAVLRRIADAGTTVIVVEHNHDVIRAADWSIEMGPGSGPAGGRVLYQGSPAGLARSATATGRALRAPAEHTRRSASEARTPRPSAIEIRGARENNLRSVDVTIPYRKLVAVTGPSGSGKSSLLKGVLEAEARNRIAQSLSTYERQSAAAVSSVDVDSIRGLGVTATLRPTRSMHNPRSTVGAVSRVEPDLTVLYAEAGETDCPRCGGSMLRRPAVGLECRACGAALPAHQARHFSPRTYSAACLKCSGLGVLYRPNPDKLIRNPERPLCDGAMYSPGFFPGGYLCKPGNHGYDLLRALARRFGFDPETTPWKSMTTQAKDAFLYGVSQPLEVPHQRGTEQAETTTVRFPGFYGWLGDWDTSGTYTDETVCPECHGAGLREPFRTVRLSGLTIFELRTLPVAETGRRIARFSLDQFEVDARRHRTDCRRRLEFLTRVGLGYLHLDRPTATLSAGEAQRVRLAALLAGDLCDLTVLLDEPSRGLHPSEVLGLAEVLGEIRDAGNTVIVVDHDPVIIEAADIEIALGPGAGQSGGKIVSFGPPRDGLCRMMPRRSARPHTAGDRVMRVTGARANNLDIDELSIPLGRLVGVCGVSGSGKSSLVVDTLGRALAPVRHTTSVASEPVDPGRHDAITGAPERAVVVTQARAGVSSAADYLGLPKALAKAFATECDCDPEDLLNRCEGCGGRGVIRTDMGFLAPLSERCEQCGGSGYAPRGDDDTARGYTFAEMISATIEEISRTWSDVERVANTTGLLCRIGLGYLVANQPGPTLSGGELQRLKIAKELTKRATRETLYILDEPTTGQSLREIEFLVDVLAELCNRGRPASTVLVLEHSPEFLASCDWLIELGPGGGPDGGCVIAAGTPEQIAAGSTPTARYIGRALR